jgi:hypothetical protein
VAGDQLHAFVERIENIEEEIKGLTEDKKEIFAEAKREPTRSLPARARRCQTRQEGSLTPAPQISTSKNLARASGPCSFCPLTRNRHRVNSNTAGKGRRNAFA